MGIGAELPIGLLRPLGMDFFQHTAMIPPCAFANWLHGLHGEAFEEVVFLFFSFPLSTQVVSILHCQLLLSGRAPGRAS